MISEHLVNLSRLQFAVTAMYHFLFVPLTLGMTFLLVIMESLYVLTGRQVYQDMTRFWGKLFGINFALGVTTGITMEFQFGTNWAYYSHYVGDVFGAPLAIEGLMAFFLESTFVGLFFFGWERLSKGQHLMVTTLMAIGTNLSALWILIANGWMQDPVGAVFDPTTMRMELSSMATVIFNPTAQAKFVHTVAAGYVTGSVFVLAISAYYLLQRRYVDFAERSFRIAAAFGFAAVCSVIVLGDESGYTLSESQQTKLAAIEAMWQTEAAPASFVVFALPDQQTHTNRWEIRIPWLLGLIGTRSVDRVLPGIDDIEAHNLVRIRSGVQAVAALTRLREHDHSAATQAQFQAHQQDLGFGLLVKKYRSDVEHASEAQLRAAAADTIPQVAPLFFAFRLMVLFGFALLALFAAALYHSLRQRHYGGQRWRWLLWAALLALPLPYLSVELGWFVAEFGRQPWTIYGILPTHLSVSSLTATSVLGSLAGFVIFYSLLLVAEMYLMIKFTRLGPASLGLARYAEEKQRA